ncbi:hypothetical protein EMIT0P260_30387 [Pseudomonas sp. IT-P260]
MFTRGYGVGDAKTTPHPSDFVRALQTALLESRHTAYGRKQSFVDGSYRPIAAAHERRLSARSSRSLITVSNMVVVYMRAD